MKGKEGKSKMTTRVKEKVFDTSGVDLEHSLKNTPVVFDEKMLKFLVQLQGKKRSFLSIDEVAKVLDVSRATVKKMIDNHSLPAYTIGSQYRIFVSSLVEYMQSNTTVMQSPEEIEADILEAIERSA